ncbi:MAG: glycosyltransferase family 2 protein, partial [Patescibacteria group bacterium]
MKLIVIIPSFNEEKSLPSVIKSIPKRISGISKIEVLVLDDGSTDHTVQVAKKAGATFVVSHSKRLGLATSFKDAVVAALSRGADIIVNTDADNQYDQREIVKLVHPILMGKADLVIGDRQVTTLSHMQWQKKYGNRLGSFIIRWLTGTAVKDASSGFRAFTASCARSL